MTYLLILCGLSLLLLGANYLVESSVAIAQRAHISNFVIGLTIIGFGTSAPELFVSISSALNGHADMSVGNILGSNICNVLLILGATALIRPIRIPRKRDTLWSISAALLLIILCYFPYYIQGHEHTELNRISGFILLAVFAFNMWYVIRQGKNAEEKQTDNKTSLFSRLHVLILLFIAVISLILLLWGGNIFLDNTVALAKQLGMSDYVISCTIVAIGTSMPELITCIIAAVKGNADLALGNVLGSNVFNILMILGITSVISPFQIQGVSIVDFAVLLGSAIWVWLGYFLFTGKYFDRREGAICLVAYIAYTYYLLFWR